MRMKSCFLSLMLLLVVFKVEAGQPVQESTSKDQSGMAVTIYNKHLGLIKDTRKVRLPEGEGELRFMDVASHINPVTVHVKSLNQPKSFDVLEQNYEYDLMNANKLLDKYVGKKVKIVDWNKYQDRKEEVEAVLLSNNNGQIYRIGNEIYLGRPGVKVLPEIPANLIAKPTLMWLYANRTKETHDLEISYLTNNIHWRADYVLILNENDTAADLSGWVTIDNKSGATYKDAQLKLVAGDVNRVQQVFERRLEERAYAMKADAGASFQEKEFFEYHIYGLQRKTTIKDKQTKQISLLEASGVKTEKELLVYGNKHYFTRRYSRNDPKRPVNVHLNFKNSKNNNLGMPLPKGVIRLYKKDHDASLQFIGEDRIDHTPKEEEVKLKIGKAFDVVAERRQVDYKKISSGLHESSWEITLRNHKGSDVVVGVVEPLYGNWSVIKNSHPYKKKDAFTIRFDVKVPKNGEVKVNYRVKVGL